MYSSYQMRHENEIKAKVQRLTEAEFTPTRFVENTVTAEYVELRRLNKVASWNEFKSFKKREKGL